jgi:molecular chaperone GrpE
MSTDPQQTPPEFDPALDGDARAHASADALPPEGELPATDQVAKLTAERDDMRDRWLRAEAEMQNVRARAKRDVDDTRQYAVQKFATDVVEAAENLRRGLSSLPPAAADEPAIVTKLREGFEGVERAFVGILERNGIKREDPTGRPFDANLHQAMAEQPSADHPPGTVIQAWTQGWTLHGRLLKPAMVVVAKAAPGSGGVAAAPNMSDRPSLDVSA